MKDFFFLKTSTFLKGQFLNLLSRDNFASQDFPKIAGYSLISPLKEQTDANHNSIGIYSKDNQKVIIKHLTLSNNVMSLYQFRNEESMLKLFNELSQIYKSKVSFPKLLQTVENQQEKYLVIELLSGKLLKNFEPHEQVAFLEIALKEFEKIHKHIPQKIKSELPIRSRLLMHLTLPIYCLVVSVKQIKNLPLYLRMVILYYRNALYTIFSKPEYILAHKDLHGDNMMIEQNHIQIIDPQVSVLSEQHTDLAIIARLHLPTLGSSQLHRLISSFIHTKQDAYRFIRLSIYFSFQLMSIKGVKHKYYNTAIEYLKALESDIQPYLMKHTS